MNKKKYIQHFTETEALLNGHFLLTSGRHSAQYFQCAKVLQYPSRTKALCEEISGFFKDAKIDTVIAPALGGIIVGQEVARLLNVRSIFTERENKQMLLRRGFSLSKGERVLICEDVVTTGGSVFEVLEIAKNANCDIVGVGFIVDRSNGKVNFGFPQKSVIALEVVSYEPSECPICKLGVPLIKPGSRI